MDTLPPIGDVTKGECETQQFSDGILIMRMDVFHNKVIERLFLRTADGTNYNFGKLYIPPDQNTRTRWYFSANNQFMGFSGASTGDFVTKLGNVAYSPSCGTSGFRVWAEEE